MDRKASLLVIACVLTSLEVAVMLASLVAGSVLPQGSGAAAALAPSLADRVSDWLMIGHNFLEACVYAILAWLLATNNRAYAIAGFVSVFVGLAALSASIFIEVELLPSPSDQLHLPEPFGVGYGTVDVLLGLIGAFSILPANTFFALATLRYSESHPVVPAILFLGIPIGLINLFIPDDATSWVQFLGLWLVPAFVLTKQLVLLWWFTSLLQPLLAPNKSDRRWNWLVDLPGLAGAAATNTRKLESIPVSKSR